MKNYWGRGMVGFLLGGTVLGQQGNECQPRSTKECMGVDSLPFELLRTVCCEE